MRPEEPAATGTDGEATAGAVTLSLPLVPQEGPGAAAVGSGPERTGAVVRALRPR